MVRCRLWKNISTNYPPQCCEIKVIKTLDFPQINPAHKLLYCFISNFQHDMTILSAHVWYMTVILLPSWCRGIPLDSLLMAPVGTSSDILSIRLPRLGKRGPPVTLHTNNTTPYHIMTTVLHVNLLLITVSLWGNPLVTCRVSPQRASNVGLWCLPSRKPEQTFEQAGRFETQILMGVPMTLSWSPCYWLKNSSVCRFYKLFKFLNHAMNNILFFC